MRKKKSGITFNKWIKEKGHPYIMTELGIGQKTIGVWERGQGWPSTIHMQKIVKLTKGEITYEMMIDGIGR